MSKKVSIRVISSRNSSSSSSSSGDEQLHSLASFTEETSVLTKTIEEKTVRQGSLAVEVEKPKFQLCEAKSTLLADKELVSKLDGSCAAQASEWEERQRLIHDTIKLLNDDDSLELFKVTLPSQTQMQLQNDKRGVARRARAAPRNSPGSPRVNWISIAYRDKSVDFSRVISMIEEMSLFHEEVECRC